MVSIPIWSRSAPGDLFPSPLPESDEAHPVPADGDPAGATCPQRSRAAQSRPRPLVALDVARSELRRRRRAARSRRASPCTTTRHGRLRYHWPQLEHVGSIPIAYVGIPAGALNNQEFRPGSSGRPLAARPGYRCTGHRRSSGTRPDRTSYVARSMQSGRRAEKQKQIRSRSGDGRGIAWSPWGEVANRFLKYRTARSDNGDDTASAGRSGSVRLTREMRAFARRGRFTEGRPVDALCTDFTDMRNFSRGPSKRGDADKAASIGFRSRPSPAAC